MRILMLAPFPRDRGHGGSQRATAVAERLEDRGIAVGWQVIRPRTTSGTEKLRSLWRREPSLSGMYDVPSRLLPGPWDALLVAHSYVVSAVLPLAGRTPVIADFHNLEWQQLVDRARLELQSGRRAPARRAYLSTQVALMRRLERDVIDHAALSLFVTPADLQWARRSVGSAHLTLVPSVLPRRALQDADAIGACRRPEADHLAYVGTLTFPTNLLSLRRFLVECWPSIREANPKARLSIAGACSDGHRQELERHPGVEAMGFVEDLTPALASCAALLMPFDGVAGTSLRGLYYALAGLPVIGPRQAFRGLPFRTGTVVRTPADWARAVSDLTLAPERTQAAVLQAREAARCHHRDEAPWDRLVSDIAALAAPGADAGELAGVTL